MKNSTLLQGAIAAAFALVIGIGNASGPAASTNTYTGAPSTGGGTEGTCNTCHNSGAGTYGEPAVNWTISETNGGANVTNYIPGQTYFVTVNVTAPMGTPAAYGFSSTFLIDGTINNAGTPSAPDANTRLSVNSGRTYVEHNKRTAPGTWNFQWTAPLAGTGTVKIYSSGNAVNTAPGNFGGTDGDSGSTSPTIITLNEALLPVDLTNIQATTEKKTVKLSWRTASEDNASHYSIERSLNGERFQAVDNVPATGSRDSETGYTYTDQHPVTGDNFYRLKMVDLDGTFGYSPVVSATVEASNLHLGAFPNPTAGMVRLSSQIAPGTSMTLRDGFGRQLWTGKAGSGIDLGPYPTGVYLLEAVIDGERTIERIVKR